MYSAGTRLVLLLTPAFSRGKLAEYNHGGTKMSERLEAKTVREYTDSNGEVKKAWTKCGVAFPFKQGTGYMLKLDSFPVNGELVLTPPFKDDKDGGGGAAPPKDDF